METQRIHEIALGLRIVPQALGGVTARVQAHFAGSAPTPAAVEQFLTALPVWTKVGMDEATFDRMPATWRLDQARSFAPPPQSRRPVLRPLTPQELATLDERTAQEHWSQAERTEQGRLIQQSPLPPQQGA